MRSKNFHRLKAITVLFGIVIFLIPIQARATPCCVQYLNGLITSCRVVVQHEQCAAGEHSEPTCERIAQSTGALVHALYGDVTGGWGLCAQALSSVAIPTPDAGEPLAQPAIPRLQIPDLTDLLHKPFAEQISTETTEEGRFLRIEFIGQYIVALYRYLVGISALLASIIIIWAGLKWLLSAGNPERITDARKKLSNALVGLFLVVGSFVILQLVNPGLTLFKPLRIKYIDTVPLIIENPVIPGATSDAPAGTYDSLFQKYAACVGIDWRVLRMIAQKESNLNPGLVNAAGFIGLFQTKPVYCESALGEQFADNCTEGRLTNPSVNIAVGAMQQRQTLRLIEELCQSGNARAQFTVVYGVLNSGIGATRSALEHAERLGGCTPDNLRAGFAEFWKQHKNGRTARWFINYYGSARCAGYANTLDCMGTEKYNHTLRMADALIAQGVTAVRAETSGECPLNTANPFPPS